MEPTVGYGDKLWTRKASCYGQTGGRQERRVQQCVKTISLLSKTSQLLADHQPQTTISSTSQ